MWLFIGLIVYEFKGYRCSYVCNVMMTTYLFPGIKCTELVFPIARHLNTSVAMQAWMP